MLSLVRKEEYENVYVFANIKRISKRRINQRWVGVTKREARFC